MGEVERWPIRQLRGSCARCTFRLPGAGLSSFQRGRGPPGSIEVLVDVVIGLLAVVVGLAFCFRGYSAMRVIIPIWGAFAGFLLGVGLVAGFTGEGLLASATAWLVGLGVALLFGLLAYLSYALSVVVSMGAIGFALGTGVMAVLGVSWSWVIILVGVAAGILLAVIAIATNLPMALLAILTALGGSSVTVSGLMLLFGTIGIGDLSQAATTRTLDDPWWWYAIYLGLAVAGVMVQLSNETLRRGSLRSSWDVAGGRRRRH